MNRPPQAVRLAGVCIVLLSFGLFDGHLGQCVAITHHEEAVLFCQQLQGEVCQGVFQYHITTDWGVATSTWLIIVGDASDDVSPP